MRIRYSVLALLTIGFCTTRTFTMAEYWRVRGFLNYCLSPSVKLTEEQEVVSVRPLIAWEECGWVGLGHKQFWVSSGSLSCWGTTLTFGLCWSQVDQKQQNRDSSDDIANTLWIDTSLKLEVRYFPRCFSSLNLFFHEVSHQSIVRMIEFKHFHSWHGMEESVKRRLQLVLVGPKRWL